MQNNIIKKKRLRVLLIRFSSIGDIILTTPVIRALKESYPDLILDYLTLKEYAILLKDNPYIDNLITTDRKGTAGAVKTALQLRGNNYDFIFDLHRSTRSLIFRAILKADYKYKFKKNYIKRFLLTAFKLRFYRKPYSVVNRYFNTLKRLNLPNEHKSEIWLNTDDVKKAILKINKIAGTKFSFIAAAGGAAPVSRKLFREKERRMISIMPFAKWKTKEWGDDKFIGLGLRLKKAGVILCILGGTEDAERADKIAHAIGKGALSLAGKLTLAETATALAVSDCLVTNDTGVMHIGGAVSIPVVAVFGSTAEELGFFPYKSEGEVVQIDLKCRPCTAKGLPACPKKHFKCMNDISVDMVYSTVRKCIGTLL
ncbi:MAG: glycosyltransferase family 9 protein [Spirochaetota bacterium]